MAKPRKKPGDNTIIDNRLARHNYFIENDLEAGVCLEGWEVKALRAGQGQIKEAYAIIQNGELYLVGAHITPLSSASTHVTADPTRSRKLLLNRREIDQLIGAVERKGKALVPLSLYWKKGRVKLKLGIATGKKKHDKRADAKDRDWARQKARMLKH